MPNDLPEKIVRQIERAGLPTSGQHPFRPKLSINRRGEKIIERKAVQRGPKKGKRGFVDDQDRIWVRDRGHAGLPDHWDVQLDDGDDYFRVDYQGEEIQQLGDG